MKINIALATDDNYAKYCSTVMISVIENKRLEDEISFHIMHSDDLNNDNIEKMKKIGDVNFYYVDKNIFTPYFKNMNNLWSVATLYRLKIATILNHIDKVIYLDCDTLVLNSLHELYEENMQDNILYGIRDYCCEASMKRNNIPDKYFYFNAGVLMINLQKMREENIEDKLFDFLVKNWEHLDFGDQDVLNSVLYTRTKEVERKYNYIVPAIILKEKEKDLNPTIAHYAGVKPWEKCYNNKFRDMFWTYFEKSPVITKEYYNEKFKEYKNRQTRFNQVLMLLKMYPLAFLKNDKHHQLLKTIIKNS